MAYSSRSGRHSTITVLPESSASLLRYLATDPGVFVAAMFLLGLAAGSFVNVVVFRLPRMMEAAWRAECRAILEEGSSEADPSGEHSPGGTGTVRFDLVHPPSACPACGRRIPVLENVPVASYVMLRGRCSACGWRIPVRYPIVEVCGALVAGAAALRFGPGAEAAGAALLGWGLLAAGAIDLDTRLLPDSITLPLLWLGLAFNLFGTFAPLHDAVIGAIAGYLSLWAVCHGFRLLTGREGMGHGDFKLLALLGAWLGWTVLPAVVVLASLAGVIAGIVLIARGRASRHTPWPFGPYLAAAGLLALYFGDALAAAWPGYAGAGT